jgi:hypothetical protein
VSENLRLERSIAWLWRVQRLVWAARRLTDHSGSTDELAGELLDDAGAQLEALRVELAEVSRGPAPTQAIA